MAALSVPRQGNELQQQEAAHHREMALDMLSEIASVFDFPDLNRFLSVSSLVPLNACFVSVCVYSWIFILVRYFFVKVTDLNFFL